jgi:hypothetical protein
VVGVNWPYGTTADWARGATACDVVMDMPLVLSLLPKCEELATFCHLRIIFFGMPVCLCFALLVVPFVIAHLILYLITH